MNCNISADGASLFPPNSFECNSKLFTCVVLHAKVLVSSTTKHNRSKQESAPVSFRCRVNEKKDTIERHNGQTFRTNGQKLETRRNKTQVNTSCGMFILLFLLALCCCCCCHFIAKNSIHSTEIILFL